MKQTLLQVFAARKLVNTSNQEVGFFKGIARDRLLNVLTREECEIETKLLKKFILPLVDEASRSDDEDACGVGSHDEFANVQPRHDGLARARVIRQHEAQRLLRQHGFINGGYLVWQWLYVRSVNCHHRVE